MCTQIGFFVRQMAITQNNVLPTQRFLEFFSWIFYFFVFMSRQKITGVLGFLVRNLCFAVLCLGGWRIGGSPLIGVSLGVPRKDLGNFPLVTSAATVSQAAFWGSVGNSSAKNNSRGQNSLAFLAIPSQHSCAHNPEVAGSSPVSATIKTTDFERNRWFFFVFAAIEKE